MTINKIRENTSVVSPQSFYDQNIAFQTTNIAISTFQQQFCFKIIDISRNRQKTRTLHNLGTESINNASQSLNIEAQFFKNFIESIFHLFQGDHVKYSHLKHLQLSAMLRIPVVALKTVQLQKKAN